MNTLFIIGRIAFVLVFILSGAQKLMDIPGTAAMIEPKVAIREMVVPYTAQLETATSMKMPSLLAVVAGVIEIVAALMLAFGFGTRFASVVLILFTAALVVAEKSPDLAHGLATAGASVDSGEARRTLELLVRHSHE